MKKQHDNWIIIVFLLTFVLSVLFSFVSNVITTKGLNSIILALILVLVISIGIVFDLIGTAAITAKESTFHSLSSEKIKGAKTALKLVKNNNKVSSICNDIVGDVCGIISGGLGAMLAISISSKTGLNNIMVSIGISAFISAFTVGGKAIFKVVAMKNADKIIFTISKLFK